MVLCRKGAYFKVHVGAGNSSLIYEKIAVICVISFMLCCRLI